MNYIIDAFKALEDIDDSAVKVNPKKQEVKEPSRKREPASLKESAKRTIREATGDYWVLSDGKNPRNSRVYSELADVDGFISRLDKAGTNGGYLELLHYVKGNPVKVWDSKSGRVTEAKRDRSDEMQPQFDHRQSFYGKARVIVKDDGSKVLYSYGTPVVRIKDGKVTLLRKGYLGWASSATTLRHVKEFLKQNGFKADSLKQIGADYPVEQAGVNESYDDLDVSWDSVCQEIIDKVKEVLGKDITCNDIHYDDSRAYGLYVPGETLGLNCNKFGAYRNYLGGGMRGPIENNGRAQDGTEELGEFFAKVLSEIEEMIAFDDGADECLKEGKSLKENEEVKLSDDKAVKGAIDKLSNKEEEEPTEKIVDADADTIDKVKDSYLGNAVLICKKCREPFFRKPEELRKDEDNDKLFNVGDACPHCGSETGYELGGQIAKLDVESEDEDSEDKREEGKDKPEEGKRNLTPIDIPEEGSEEDNDLMKAESFDNSGFDKLINKHLSEVYSNVVSYETKSGEVSGKELTLEGTIKYKDGKEEQVRFVFEAVKTTNDKKIVLSGLNEKMAGDKGSYRVVAKVSDNSIMAESMSCNYRVRLNDSNKVVRGRYFLNKGLAEAWAPTKK